MREAWKRKMQETSMAALRRMLEQRSAGAHSHLDTL